MTVKVKITNKLKEVFEPGVVTAGQIYKGFDYDGIIEGTGWWFSFFNGSKIFLGSSLDAAIETVDQIAGGRE